MKGFPGNMGQFMKEAQKMQERMAAVEEELAQTSVEGTSGGGMVSVTANGKQEVLKVRIDPQVVEKTEVEMLEDLVLAAVNDARLKALDLAREKMGAVTGGLGGLPGLF